MADNFNQSKCTKVHNDELFLLLNDDCLLHLCQYLSLFEIIKLGKTCTRLKLFVEHYIYPKYHKLDFKNLRNLNVHEICPEDVNSCFELLGEYIQQLYSQCEWIAQLMLHDQFVSMIYTHLNNLQELHLQYLELNSEYTFHTVSQLKVVHLEYCYGFGDRFLQFIPNVIDLHLNGIYDFKGDGLTHLKHVQSLSIKYCKKLQCEKLLEWLKDNREIVQFTLAGCGQLLSQCSGFHAIISNLKSLQYLCSDSLKDWPLDQFDSLKSLKAFFSNIPSLKGLADKDQLVELNIDSCRYFVDTEANFQQYLLRFNKLKIVHLNESNFINQELLIKLTEKLDITELGCVGVQLTDRAIIQLVVHSKNLKFYSVSGIKSTTIRSIIELVNGDTKRSNLELFVDRNEETELLFGTHGRVHVKNQLQEPNFD